MNVQVKEFIQRQQGGIYIKNRVIILNEASQLEQTMNAYGKGQHGVIRIGSVAMGIFAVTRMIKSAKNQQQMINFSLQQGDTYVLENLVNTQQIDLALVHLPLTSISQDIIVIPLMRSRFQALCHIDSPLTNYTQLTLALLSKHPLALMRRKTGFGIYDNVLLHFAKAKLKPHILVDANDVPMLISLVQQNLAIALIPEIETVNYDSNIVTLPVPELDLVADELALIYLAQQANNNSLLQAIDYFKNLISTIPAH